MAGSTGHSEQKRPEETGAQVPQVYAVQKDLAGWKFNRRDFLTAIASHGKVDAFHRSSVGIVSPNELFEYSPWR